MTISGKGITATNNSSSSTIPLTEGHILVGNSSDEAADVAVSGAITIDEDGVVTFAPSPVFTGAAIVQAAYSANSGANITIDPANGAFQEITLTANTTITLPTALAAGKSQEITLILIQDGVGSRTADFVNATYYSGYKPFINSSIGAQTTIYFKNSNLGCLLYAGDPTGTISSTLAIGSATSLTTGTAKTITSITLTEGVWNVWGNVGAIAAAGTIPTILEASISMVNNTQATSPNNGAYVRQQLPFATAGTQIAPVGTTQITVGPGLTAVVYLVLALTFTVSTATGYGSIFSNPA